MNTNIRILDKKRRRTLISKPNYFVSVFVACLVNNNCNGFFVVCQFLLLYCNNYLFVNTFSFFFFVNRNLFVNILRKKNKDKNGYFLGGNFHLIFYFKSMKK